MDNENVEGVVGVVGRLYNIYIHVYVFITQHISRKL